MDYVSYLLFFIAGAIIVFVFYNIRFKKAITLLNTKIVELENENKQIRENYKNNPAKPEQQIEPNNKPNQLQKTVDDLYIVNELGQNVTSSLNLQETFYHLYTTINSMMDAAVLELSVYNESTKGWKIISNIKQPEDVNSNTYINHLAEWCFKNNRDVFLADAEKDYERYVFKPLTMPDGRIAKSVIAFPVLNNDVVSGTLCIISFQKNSFSEYHQKIIRLLLGYISVAMQNAITHEELNVTKQRAERSEKFMQQFLANMSHEIRTPINAVTGMTRLLLEKNPKAEQIRYLHSIRSASDSLLIIINDILDLSKIEAGKIEIEHIDFSVFDLVNNVKEIMQFKSEEKGLVLIMQVEPTISPVLIGDPTRLTQILINLVGNAIKFTDKGSIELKVRSSRFKVDNATTNMNLEHQTLHFSIIDSGIGMTNEQQQKLFQDYVQASTDTARKYGGTGLGLSISKQLVQLQGGTIEVNSRLGEGSTFSFTLTYPVSKNKTVARKEKTVSKQMLDQLKGIKILLADDNEYNRIVAKETLQLKIENVIVEEAFDGEMAVAMIKQDEYDIVLMDLVMPKMNGLEATEMIRKNFTSPKNQVKIVALTASVVKSEIDKCYASGMNGFIPKPFKAYELLGAIYNALYEENKTEFEEIVITHDSPIPSGKVIDLNYLTEFTEGDQVRFQRYIDLFLSKVPVSIANLKSALEKKDYEKIRIESHSMKPQLRSMGVIKGFDLAETIEQYCKEKAELDKLPELIEQLTSVCQIAIEEVKSLKAEA